MPRWCWHVQERPVTPTAASGCARNPSPQTTAAGHRLGPRSRVSGAVGCRGMLPRPCRCGCGCVPGLVITLCTSAEVPRTPRKEGTKAPFHRCTFLPLLWCKSVWCQGQGPKKCNAVRYPAPHTLGHPWDGTRLSRRHTPADVPLDLLMIWWLATQFGKLAAVLPGRRGSRQVAASASQPPPPIPPELSLRLPQFSCLLQILHKMEVQPNVDFLYCWHT